MAHTLGIHEEAKERFEEVQDELNQERSYHVTHTMVLEELISAYELMEQLVENHDKEWVKEQARSGSTDV